MNSAFFEFLRQSDNERRASFQETATRLDTAPKLVEKDYWVCLTLDVLYNGLPDGHPRLLFKGGTSLSKAYDLIERFSEDVDVTVFPEYLGFSAERDPTDPNNEMSNTKRRKLFEELRLTCRDYMQNKLCQDLQAILSEVAPHCAVVEGVDDADGQTLLVEYPSLFYGTPGLQYVQPHVKLEGGARSALDPNVERKVAPYINADLADLDLSVDGITTILPARTFYDKIMVMHGTGCGARDEGRLPGEDSRLSRHYYDAAKLFDCDDAMTMLQDRAIWDSVREHTQLAFRQAWKKIHEAVPGTTCVIPHGDLCNLLQRDYENMHPMLFGERPTWEWVMQQLEGLEAVVNET